MKFLCFLFTLATAVGNLVAQTSSSEPASMTCIAIGYEMSQDEADKLLKSNDPAADVNGALKQIANRVASRAVTVSSITTVTTNSGQRAVVRAGATQLTFEGTFAVDRKFASVNAQIQKTAQAVTKTASAKVDMGSYMYLGMIPGAKAGSQELLFLRVLMQ